MTTATETQLAQPDVASPPRLWSVDAVRGLAIVIMLLAVHPLPREHLPAQLRHPDWHGLTFADLFFPVFLFVVGISMALSRRGTSPRTVMRRTVLLVALGVALASLKRGGLAPAGVLQHIAGAYVLAWLVLRTPRRVQYLLCAALLAAVWVAFVLYAGEGGDPWGRSGTLAHHLDRWLLGSFSTEGVLPTITSAVTVVGGAWAGRLINQHADRRALVRAIARTGAAVLGAGMVLAVMVPINKKLWTPSFAVVSLGASYGWLALAVWLIDIRRPRRWVVPLRELGMNPIAIYVVFMAAAALIDDYRHVWPDLTPFGSDAAGAMVYAGAWLVLGWAFARLLHRRQIYVKL